MASQFHDFIVIFLGQFCPKWKGVRRLPYVKCQSMKGHTTTPRDEQCVGSECIVPQSLRNLSVVRRSL